MILFIVALFAVLLSDRAGLFLAINNGSMVFGDPFWTLFSNLGDGFVALLALAFVIRKRPDIVHATLIGTVIALPFAQGGKFITTVVRPGYFFPDMVNIVGSLPSSWSFPSGHTATGALVFGIMFLMADRKLFRWIAFSLMILVGFSRIAVGVHWPLDVVCGWIVGLSSAVAGVLLTKDDRKCRLSTAILSILLTVASINFIVDYHLNPVMPVFQYIFGGVVCIFAVHASITILKEVYHGKYEKRS